MRPASGSHRRPTVSWPAALLPGALLLSLLTTAGTPSVSDVPATELHVVDARDR
jgi:hypothetical protein